MCSAKWLSRISTTIVIRITLGLLLTSAAKRLFLQLQVRSNVRLLQGTTLITLVKVLTRRSSRKRLLVFLRIPSECASTETPNPPSEGTQSKDFPYILSQFNSASFKKWWQWYGPTLDRRSGYIKFKMYFKKRITCGSYYSTGEYKCHCGATSNRTMDRAFPIEK